MHTHYDELKVKQDAPLEVIRAAYKVLCQKYHPDKFPGREESANKIMKTINAAFALLSNPDKRRAYDALIAETTAKEANKQQKAAEARWQANAKAAANNEQVPTYKPNFFSSPLRIIGLFITILAMYFYFHMLNARYGAATQHAAIQSNDVVCTNDTEPPQDNIASLTVLRKNANNGDIAAQFQLGVMYDYGWSVPKNRREAVNWYHKAAAQGHTAAQFHLGMLNNNGKPVRKNNAVATNWCQKLSAQLETQTRSCFGIKHIDNSTAPKSNTETAKPLLSGRYQDNGDGTITDLTTNLMWKRCPEGQIWNNKHCIGKSHHLSWDEIMPNERQRSWRSFAGYTDWRVPTIENLHTLVYCSSGKPKTWNNTGDSCAGKYATPTIDTSAFPYASKYDMTTWSASASDRPLARSLGFAYGDNGWESRSNAHTVRLVRGG